MADRDVRVSLKLEATGNAPAALKDLASSADRASTSMAKASVEAKALSGAKAEAAAKDYDRLSSAAAKAATGAKAANDAVSRGGAAASSSPIRPTAPGAFTSVGGFQGAVASLGGPAAIGAAAVAGGKGIADSIVFASKAIDAMGDSSLSASQKFRKVAEELPVAGAIIKAAGSLADALSGKTESIRRSTREAAASQVQSAADLAAYQSASPVQQNIAALKARNDALKAAGPGPTFGENAPSRDSFQGELDYQKYERQAPLLQDERKAGINAAAATAVASKATEERQRLEAALAAQQLDKDRKIKAFDAVAASGGAAVDKSRTAFVLGLGYTSAAGEQQPKASLTQKFTAAIGLTAPGANLAIGSAEDKNRIEKGSDLKASLAEELKLRQQLITATQAEAEAQKAAAQAGSDVRKASIALAKDELASLKEREQFVKQTSTSFGSLSAVDKQAALEAAYALKAKGYDNLTPEAKGALQAGGFGAVLAKEAEKSAQADPLYQQATALLGLESDLKAIQKQSVKAQVDLNAKIEFDETALSDKLEKVLTPLFENLLKSFTAVAQAQVNQAKVNQTVTNAQQ